ncbi:MAG TPA: glycosyltransferase family 39 protein [Opitutaceae bacterium]
MPESTDKGARITLGIGLIAYAVLLIILLGAVPGGSDNSGYFNEARLFARGRMEAPMRTLKEIPPSESGYLYVPLGFKPAVDGSASLVPTYPPGLPLLLVPTARIAGWKYAGDLLLLIHSLAGLALTFSLGRICGLTGSWSLAGAAILAASPLYLFMSVQALSDVPATAWATAAVVAALRGREKTGWALASGACIGVGFLIRPNNILVALPVILAVAVSPRRFALLALGAAPFGVAWMAINHAAYGAALESGYGAIGNEFHVALIGGTLAYYIRWLPVLLSPVAILAAGIPVLSNEKPRITAVLAWWIFAYMAFFAPYRWTHEQWWFLRFLLPAAPAMIVGGLMVSGRLIGKLRGHMPRPWITLLPFVLLAAAIGIEVGQREPRQAAQTIGHGELKYGRVCAWLNAHAPANAAIVTSQTSGALFYFTPFLLLRSEEMKPPMFERVRGSLRAEGRPLYAALFPFEVDILRKLPGRWSHVVSVDDVSIWSCDLGPSGP